MANAFLAPRNYIDATFYTVAFSGGSWTGLSNLAADRLSLVARSADATTTNTQFDVDLGAIRDISMVFIPRSNLSLAARFRIRLSNAAGDFSAPVADSGWQDLYGIIYPWGSVTWGHPGLWTGRMPAEDAAGYPMPLMWLFGGAPAARYVRVEIDDTTNADGYIELSRLFISPPGQRSLNIVYGSEIGWQDDSVRSTSLGGVDFYSERGRRRVVVISWDYLPTNEAFVNIFDMQQRLGKTKQTVFSWDPADTANRHRHSMLCTLEQLDPLRAASFGVAGTGAVLREVL